MYLQFLSIYFLCKQQNPITLRIIKCSRVRRSFTPIRFWECSEIVSYTRIESCSLSISRSPLYVPGFLLKVSRSLSETLCYESAGNSNVSSSNKSGSIIDIDKISLFNIQPRFRSSLMFKVNWQYLNLQTNVLKLYNFLTVIWMKNFSNVGKNSCLVTFQE